MATITKTNVELYKIRGLEHHGWADITIDAQGEKGRISIASDYGNWQNFWNACGTDFKTFLTQLSIDYVAGKFRADEWFDVDKTIKYYREAVTEALKYKDISKKKADDLRWEISELQYNTQKTSFIVGLNNSPNLLSFYDSMPDLSYSIDPLFKRFWEECWIPLMSHFKQEKENLVVKDVAAL